MPLKGGGVGPLMANAILNFHFDFLTTSLSRCKNIQTKIQICVRQNSYLPSHWNLWKGSGLKPPSCLGPALLSSVVLENESATDFFHLLLILKIWSYDPTDSSVRTFRQSNVMILLIFSSVNLDLLILRFRNFSRWSASWVWTSGVKSGLVSHLPKDLPSAPILRRNLSYLLLRGTVQIFTSHENGMSASPEFWTWVLSVPILLSP